MRDADVVLQWKREWGFIVGGHYFGVAAVQDAYIVWEEYPDFRHGECFIHVLYVRVVVVMSLLSHVCEFITEERIRYCIRLV